MRRVPWREFKTFVPIAKDMYRYVLSNDERAYDELIGSIARRDSEAFALLQGYVAGFSVQVLHTDRSLSELDEAIDSWTNFLAERTDRTKMKMLLRRYVDASAPQPFRAQNHFDYVAQYMPVVVALGAFGLDNCPTRHAPWTTEFDTIVTLARRDVFRLLWRGPGYVVRVGS